MITPVRHKLGVHIGMPHEEYLEDCGLGYSAMSQASKSVVEMHWASKWNPLRPPEKPNSAFDRGTALHTAWLDGMDAYRRSCVIKPETYIDEKTGEEKRWNGNANVCKRWLEQHDRPGVNIITAEDDAAIQLATRMAFDNQQTMDVEGGALRLADAFTGGLSEVSVFWDHDRIPMRARFDKLQPNCSIDLKSLTDWKRGDFNRSLLREIVIRGYLIQMVHYTEARHALRQAVAEGRVYGATPEQMEVLQEIADATEWSWCFVMCKLDGCPLTRVVVVDDQALPVTRARQKWEEAVTMVTYFVEKFGWEQMWADGQLIYEPEAADWPDWAVTQEG